MTQDTRSARGIRLHEQRLDETQTGDATTITLIDGKRPADWVKQHGAERVAEWLGLKATGMDL